MTEERAGYEDRRRRPPGSMRVRVHWGVILSALAVVRPVPGDAQVPACVAPTCGPTSIGVDSALLILRASRYELGVQSALAKYREASEAFFKNQRPSLGFYALDKVASELFIAKSVDSARTVLEEALRRGGDSLAPEERANTWRRIGLAFRAAGADGAAKDALERSLIELLGKAYRDTTAPPAYTLTATAAAWDPAQVWSLSLASLGAMHRAAGRSDTAFALLRRSYHVDRANIVTRLAMNMPTAFPDFSLTCLARDNARFCPDSAVNAIDVLRNQRERAVWAGDVLIEAQMLGQLSRSFRTLGRSDSSAHYDAELTVLRKRVGMSVNLQPAKDGSPEAPRGRNSAWGSMSSTAPSMMLGVHDRQKEGRRALAAGHSIEALRAFRSALVRLDSISPLDVGWTDVGARNVRAALFTDIARGFRALRPARVDSATRYYDLASAEFLNQLTSAPDDETRVATAELSAAVHSEWATMWLGRVSGSRATDAAKAALAAVDRGRAQALRMLRGDHGDGIDLFNSLERFAPLEDHLASSLPLFLADNTRSLLAYLVTVDSVITWLGSYTDRDGERLGFRTRVLPRARLDAMVDSVRDYLQSQARREQTKLQPQAYSDLVARLSSALLPGDLLHRLPDKGDVVIVPYGHLTQLPYSVLVQPGDSIPFGIRHALRFLPSISLLDERRTESETRQIARPLMPKLAYSRSAAALLDPRLELFQPSKAADDSARAAIRAWRSAAVVVGDVDFPTQTSWGERVSVKKLEFSHDEADAVARFFNVRPIPREESTETHIRELAATASVLHLATHGLTYSGAKVRNSWIALGRDSTNDGFLTVEEMLAPAFPMLRADLVVLSACRTATGTGTRAEGTIGLQRAVLAKGARSLVASLWDGQDAATALLMRYFYRFWLDPETSPSKAEALRLAQAEVRKTGFREPGMWALMQLIGAP